MSNSDWETVDSSSDWEPIELPDEEKPSEIESGLRGAAQMASLGYADEITGIGESLFTDKPYEQARDESRANYKTAQETNPISYGAGQVAGAIGTAFIPGMQGASIGKLAALGAAQGLGSSEADLTKGDVFGAGRDALIGGTIGAATGGAVKGAGALAGKAMSGLKNVSDDVAQNIAGDVVKGHAWNPSRVIEPAPQSMIGSAATGIGKLGDALEQIPGAKMAGVSQLAQAAPKITKFAAEGLSKSLDKIIPYAGKFAPVLQSAAARGGSALGATHFVLMQSNPEYREMLQSTGALGEEQ